MKKKKSTLLQLKKLRITNLSNIEAIRGGGRKNDQIGWRTTGKSKTGP